MGLSGRKGCDSKLAGECSPRGQSETKFRVNFLVIGAQKAGTTALASFLSQHPDICMAPCKEAHFFDHPDYDCMEEEGVHLSVYRHAFPNYSGQIAVGEATPIYAYWPWSAARIFRYNPEMKLIFLTRDPFERALSQYSMERLRGTEKKSFFWCLVLEPLILLRARNDQSLASRLRFSSYITRGAYGRQVERFLQYFPRENIRLVRSEDLKNNHYQVLAGIFNFLGVVDVSRTIRPETVFQGKMSYGKIELFFIKLLKLLFSFNYRRFKKRYSDMYL